ncbi:MAG TPA: aminopeptidase P family protein [Bacteroidales bacterium]|nr:aminopeptidase P family protein [Bacteroidales bacterium]
MNKMIVTAIGVLLFLGGTVLTFSQNPVPKEILELRRKEFMKSIGDAVAIFPGEVRNRYGQVDENVARYFYYLTGFEDSNAWLILNPGGEEKYLLFVRPFNPGQVIWTGEMPGVEGTRDLYGVDKAYSLSEFREVAGILLKSSSEVYTISNNRWLKEELTGLIPENANVTLMNAQPVLDKMRGTKDPYEIEQLRRAIEITCEAHSEALNVMKPGLWEYEIEAVIEYVFRKNGATGPSFPSIVGSGPRSTILHYETNDHQIENGDMVVMDIGSEVNHYKADVTRTIPSNGKFTIEQLEIYNLVLKAQNEAIKVMIPGEKISHFNEVASRVILEGLYELGLVTDVESSWQKEISVLYFTGHFIGLDIHDVYSYTTRNLGTMVFEPGMVITIEPGVYIHPDMLKTLHERLGSRVPNNEIDKFVQDTGPAFEKYKNIGIRIEDDILITENGNEILSKGTPKTPNEIERLMGGK